MFPSFYALYLCPFKCTFLTADQITPVLQVPLYEPFFQDASDVILSSPNGSDHSLNSHSLLSLLF